MRVRQFGPSHAIAVVALLSALALSGCSSESSEEVDAQEVTTVASERIRAEIADMSQLFEKSDRKRILGIRCNGVDPDSLMGTATQNDPVNDLETTSKSATAEQATPFLAECVMKLESWDPINKAGLETWFDGAICGNDASIIRSQAASLDAYGDSRPIQTVGDTSCVRYSIIALGENPYLCEEEFPDCPTWLEAEQSLDRTYQAMKTQVFPG